MYLVYQLHVAKKMAKPRAKQSKPMLSANSVSASGNIIGVGTGGGGGGGGGGVNFIHNGLSIVACGANYDRISAQHNQLTCTTFQ